MKKSLLLVLLAIVQSYVAKTQNWQWAKSSNGEANDYGQSITTDINGNVYVTGKFTQIFMGVPFSFGSFILTNEGGTDIFIVKYN